MVNMNLKVVAVIITLVVLIGGAFYYFKSESNNIDQESNVPEPVVSQNYNLNVGDVQLVDGDTPVSNESNIKTFEIEAGSYYFAPNELRVNLGDTVRIVLTSKDMMHNLYIDEFNVKSATVSSGKSTTFEFVADKTGEFEYYCEISNHKSLGQVGRLIVE